MALIKPRRVRRPADAVGHLRRQDRSPILQVRIPPADEWAACSISRIAVLVPTCRSSSRRGSRFKFCALIFGGEERRFDRTECAFFLHDTGTLADEDRCFPLAPDDFARVNPNTGTAPVFRTRRDAEITRRIYERHPVLVDRSGGGERPRVAGEVRAHVRHDQRLPPLQDRRAARRGGFLSGAGQPLEEGEGAVPAACTRGRWCRPSTTAPPVSWSTRENLNRPAQPTG